MYPTDSTQHVLHAALQSMMKSEKSTADTPNQSQHSARYPSWVEREKQKRAAQEAQRQAHSQRIQASRDNGGADERERARCRHLADIQAFRTLMVAALAAPAGERRSLSPGASMSSFKMICRLIAQRAHEDPAFVEPEHRKTLGFYYLMSQAPARWIAMADQLAEHAIVGMTRELMALGPFAGLRISTRAVLINAGIENVVQLRAALAARAIALDEDIAGNGLTRRRWSELRVWLGVQVDGCDA